MNPQLILTVVAFLMVGSLIVLVGLALGERQRRVKIRLQELSGQKESTFDKASVQAVSRAVHSTLPKMAKPLMPDNAEEQSRLKARLVQAGFYHPQAILIFLTMKLLLMVTPTLIGLALGAVGLLPMSYGLLFGGCFSIAGIIGPSFWLDKQKQKRQSSLRRGMPDALDLIVVCMDGGLSLVAALNRVTSELKAAHPVLAFELNLVQREVQLGHAVGDALRDFALRTDLDDVRSLAATVKNAERFGASMVKTLRTFADTLRLKRQQYAEEMAQKAGTKILFPTLVFIFPAIFLIILGPAAIQFMQTLGGMGN